jgi:hypothetical protein
MIRHAIAAVALLARAAVAQDSTRMYDVLADSSDDINAAIERSVEHMNFIARPIARHRLRVANPLPRQLRIMMAADTITIQVGAEPPAALPRDGTAVPWRSLGGDKCQASLTVAGDTLVKHVVAHGGQSEARFVLSDSGRRVREHVRISSPHLPKPVDYSVLFSRTP